MTIAENLLYIRQQMLTSLQAVSRRPNDCRLVAVSKKQSIEKINLAINAGQRDFGENYLQEALKKITVLGARDVCWHFIGDVQSNKTKAIAEHFDWVQTLSRVKIARRLNAQRPTQLPPLNVCIEVNIDEEASKAGVGADAVEDLLQETFDLPRLNVCGLMVIPRDGSQRGFERLQSLYASLQVKGWGLNTLSMGMSRDFKVAIHSGSTMIRVGTAIFGERKNNHE